MSRKLSIIALLVLIVLLTVYVIFNWRDFERIRYIQKIYFLHQSILTGLILCANGYITKIFLTLFDIKLEPKKWFGLSILGSLGNYLTPFRGGMALKAIYLKKYLGLSYPLFASTLAANYILSLLSNGILGIAALLLILRLHGTMSLKLLAFFSLIITTMILTLILSPTIKNPRNRLTRVLKSSLDGWNRIKKSRILIAKVSFLLILNYAIMCAKLYYGYRMLHVNVGILPAFLMSLIIGFGTLLALTPGNLGIQEAVVGLVSELVGTGFNEGLMVASILRVTGMVVLFALGPIFTYLLLRKRT